MKLGVFTPVFGTLKLEDMLAKVRALQHVQAVEIGTGGWPGKDHLDIDALLDKQPCAAEYRRKIEDAGLTISALSCHANPLHPDAATARTADELFRHTVRAEQPKCPSSRRSPVARAIPRAPPTELDRDSVAPEFSTSSVAGEEGDSVIVPRLAFAGEHGVKVRLKRIRVRRLQRRQRAAAAGRRPEPRRQLRPEPLLLAGRGCTAAIRARRFSRTRKTSR
jgi:hypothetical protein